MREIQSVTLETIGGGALLELFAAELERTLWNITDPNTDTTAKRVITMTVTLKPNRDRDVADVALTCSSKLAGIRTVETQLFVGKHMGKLVAVESDPRQAGLFDEPEVRLAAVSQFSQKDGD